MKKRQIGILLMVLCMIGVSSAASILWCSDSTVNDQSWVDLLEDDGYTVDRLTAAGDMTQAKVDLANTYDLVIVGRATNSGDYGAEMDLWNSITAPLICQSAWIWRNNRWKWLNSSSTLASNTNIAPDLAPGDALYDILFNGAIPDENGTFDYTDTPNDRVDIAETASAGNGTVIGHRNYDPQPWVYAAYWEQGLEFYNGAGQTAGGPRLALPGSEALALTHDGIIIFLNAVYEMSDATFDRKPSANAGNDRIANTNETITLDATAFDPEGLFTVNWTQLSGPATATFEDAAVVDPNVTFDTKGIYELKITVTDGTTTVSDQLLATVRDNADNAMIAHWDFEGLPEPNSLADITGNGFTGIYYSATDPNVVAGNMIGGSQAADLTVGDAYWEVANSDDNADPNFNDLSTGMTVAVWVKISDSSVGAPMIIGNGLDGWRLDVNAGNYNLVCHDIGLNLFGPSAYDDNWHHVVGVFDGVASQAHIYFDGALATSADVSQGSLFTKGDDYPIIQIANRGDADRPWKGYVDDIRIYNYPLNDVEIATLSSEGNLAVSVTAGDDQTIAYKGTPVQLEGELLIDDGVPAFATLEWSVVNVPVGVDPASVIFSDAFIAAPQVTFPNAEGTYVLRLTADDTEFTDFDEVSIQILIPSCADVLADGFGIAADISGPEDVSDCRVDIYDFAAMASDWLRCNDPDDVGCEWAYQQ